MNKKFFDHVNKDIPQFNPDIANGFSSTMIDNVIKSVYQLFRASSMDYPKGLVMSKITRVDPRDEIYVSNFKRNVYNVTDKTIFLVKLHFEYNRKPLDTNVYLYLPYLKDGFLQLNGSDFMIQPAMVDPCLSVTPRGLFLAMHKNRINFNGIQHWYNEGGTMRPEVVVSALLYHGGSKSDKSGKKPSTMVDYLLAKYGFYKTFEMGCNVLQEEIAIGFNSINYSNYPAEDWVICESANRETKKKGRSRKKNQPNRIRLVIKRDKLNHASRSFIAGFFHSSDHHVERFEMGGDTPETDFYSVSFYQTILAKTLLPRAMLSKALRDTINHLKSLETQMDHRSIMKLDRLNRISVEDIYGLFSYLVVNWIYHYNVPIDKLATVYGKHLSVLDYLLSKVNENINLLSYAMQPLKDQENIDPVKLKKIIQDKIGNGKMIITKINNSKPLVASAAPATDNKVAKISRCVVTQQQIIQSSKSMNGGGRKGRVPSGVSFTLSGSLGEICDPVSISGFKTGRSTLNPYLLTDDSNITVPRKSTFHIVESAQAVLSRV